MSRREDREAAQKKFDQACKAAGLTDTEQAAFGRYCHENNLLQDYMSYDEIKRLASEWKGRSGYNPYHDRRR